MSTPCPATGNRERYVKLIGKIFFFLLVYNLMVLDYSPLITIRTLEKEGCYASH